MLAILRHWLDPSYLYAQADKPLGYWPRALVLTALFLVASVLLAWAWARCPRRERSSWAAWGMFCASLSGLALLTVRLYVTGPLSARVWYFSSCVLAILFPLAHLVACFNRGGVCSRLGRALACTLYPDDTPLHWAWQTILAGLFLGGIGGLVMREGLGWWPLVLASACVLSTVRVERAHGEIREVVVRVEVLAPLALPLTSGLLRWFVGDVLNVNMALYQAFPYPNPWAPWFNARAMALAGVAWMWMGAGALFARCIMRHVSVSAFLGPVTLLVGLAWYVLLLNSHLSYGVTGSDPYCYLQMAADIVERGTALHNFSLAGLAWREGLPLWPIVHVGYRVPAADRSAPTVWPIGWPVLMSPFYALGGDRAALYAAPLCAALAALLTWRLGHRVMPKCAGDKASLLGGLAALITLTSYEGASRTLVPMADAATQALSVLSLLALVRARCLDRMRWGVLAGAALGLAYWVRHPQVFLGLAALPALLGAPWRWRRRVGHLSVYFVSALLFALPDLWYHRQVFGSPWATESEEWFLFSWRNVLPMTKLIWETGLIAEREFGYVLPFVIYGLLQQWRNPDERIWAATMGFGFLGVFGFHLCYGALRLRDLISLFPWLALWAGRGVLGLWMLAKRPHSAGEGTGHRAAVVCAVVWTLAARTVFSLNMPWYPKVEVFGHVTAIERGEYARLANSLPDGAVVGTGLNSGAVERYTGHATIRPAYWSDDEFARLVSALIREGRAVYILDDGDEMHGFVVRADARFHLRQVDEFTLPTFEGGARQTRGRAALYVLE